MKRVELYGRVRHAVMIEGLSQREAARCFGIDPRTVRKMLSYSVPPGYVRTRPPVRPKLDPFIGIIDRILEEDKDRPKKQRHTSKRICPAEFQDPSSNCLIREVETTLGKQVLNVPIAQRETAIQPDGMLDDDRRKAVTTVSPHFPSIVDIQCGEKVILL